MSGWLAVNLDGTLTEWDGVWRGPSYIGAPIARTVRRVKHWLNQGKDVRIFTARVWVPTLGLGVVSTSADAAWQRHYAEAKECRKAIDAFCTQQFGRTLPITCEKDRHAVLILDDRAQQVVPNTGALVQEELRRAVVGLKAIAGPITATGSLYTGQQRSKIAEETLASLDPWSQKLV